MSDKTVHLIYTGLVQGVGFRYSARHVARQYNLKGWVKNLSDGRVELMIQGAENNVGSFLNDFNDHFKHNITDIIREDLSVCNEFEDFQVTL